MMPTPFEYTRPGSLAEAFDELGRDGSVALAGGHSLVPMLKMRLVRPSLLVDVRAVLPRGIRDGVEIVIGAATTWRELFEAGAVREVPTAVRDCAAAIGDVQVRNHGTLGGSLAHADPASDFGAVALAVDARLRLVSATGERAVVASDFFAGPFATVLGKGELIAEIALPAELARCGSAYVAIEDPASGYALAGAAACVNLGGAGVERCRIGLTGVAETPLRLRSVEAEVTETGMAAARAATAEALDSIDALDDVHADPAYRRQLAAVVVERALRCAVERAHALT
jgi:carbon-monoxide dehydrogenase medium subunit